MIDWLNMVLLNDGNHNHYDDKFIYRPTALRFFKEKVKNFIKRFANILRVK